MEEEVYNDLELREIFHLEFLRLLMKKIKGEFFALKGGSNMRFFFQSFRYSEDMDLDVFEIKVEKLKKIVIEILGSTSFQEGLIPFGIQRIIPPDMSKAKQTETTQRFKVHLITENGLDLFTKIKFSRRGKSGRVVVEAVSNLILRKYKMAPLLLPHYDIYSTIVQKINALATRRVIQARDIFDLYTLSSQYTPGEAAKMNINRLNRAIDNVYEIDFNYFRDTVLSYLSIEEQRIYNSPSRWDEIKLKVVEFLEEFRKQ